MTENSPHSHPRSSAPVRRAPGWIAPAIAGVAAVAVTWGIGSTIFRGALIERGLPDQVSEASADDRVAWQHGARLADLASQAKALASLAPEQSAPALEDLAGSLTQGSAMLGELRFEDEQPVAIAQSYSPEAVAQLAQQVTDYSASLPAFEDVSLSRDTKLAKIAFQTNFDARQAVASAAEKSKLDLALPLSSSVEADSEDNSQLVACLPNESLLDSSTEIDDPKNIEPTVVARALDRGYALDFLLQLKAARTDASAKSEIEAQRTILGNQLRAVRSTVDPQCADLREPAYALPKDGLEQLSELSTGAQTDFAKALLVAASATDGTAGRKIASVAFEVFDDQLSAGNELAILETTKPGN